MNTKIKIHSLNMRGGRDKWKRRSVFEFLKKQRANFIFLQECHLVDDDVPEWQRDWGKGEIYSNPLSTRSAGQAILLNGNYEFVEHKTVIQGRVHLLKFKLLESLLH